MSVGVDITSYLFHRSAGTQQAREGRYVQLDDVRVPESAHVLHLALHPGLSPMLGNGVLRDELHSDLLAGHGVYGHYIPPSQTRKITRVHVCLLFTLPNVPSAISSTTVYSPSLYAGNLCG